MDKSLKILIVEDQVFTSESIKETLQMAGHKIVEIARNYTDALVAAIKLHPDMIIMDVELQDAIKDGIHLASDIRRNLNAPIVFLTGREDNETFKRASLVSPEGYLLKPFKPKDLIFQVELAYQKFASNEGIISLPESIYVYANRSHIKIRRNEVVLLEADSAWTHIFYNNLPESLLITVNIGQFIQHFPESHFYRLSQSHLINLDFLQKVKENELFFEGTNKTLKISDAKKTELKKQLKIVKSPRAVK
jgi:DNA-binding LytR/AlgR family response regulator